MIWYKGAFRSRIILDFECLEHGKIGIGLAIRRREMGSCFNTQISKLIYSRVYGLKLFCGLWLIDLRYIKEYLK